jgi:hypothetical protein
VERDADQLATSVLRRAEAAGVVLSSEIRREALAALRRLLKTKPSTRQLYAEFLREFHLVLRRYEPVLTRTVSDAHLAAWLEGGASVLRQVPDLTNFVEAAAVHLPAQPVAGSIIQFPAIVPAVNELARKGLITSDELFQQSEVSRADGFLVARTAALDALEKVRDQLAEVVVDELEPAEFRLRLADAFDASRLAPTRQEPVFRSGIMRRYAQGQRQVVEHPAVRSSAVFVLRSEINDSRLTPLCEELSKCGIDGTAIYCVDDPVWRNLVVPPSHWGCRCGAVYLTVERAARRGLKVAQRWLASGIRPPDSELFVPVPNVLFPPGWVSAWAA